MIPSIAAFAEAEDLLRSIKGALVIVVGGGGGKNWVRLGLRAWCCPDPPPPLVARLSGELGTLVGYVRASMSATFALDKSTDCEVEVRLRGILEPVASVDDGWRGDEGKGGTDAGRGIADDIPRGGLAHRVSVSCRTGRVAKQNSKGAYLASPSRSAVYRLIPSRARLIRRRWPTGCRYWRAGSQKEASWRFKRASPLRGVHLAIRRVGSVRYGCTVVE